jgi:putative aldouronate transport system permease protein
MAELVDGRSLPRPKGGLLSKTKHFIVKYKFFHLLVLPGVVYFVLFHYVPIYGLTIAFKDYYGMGGVKGVLDAPWVGFKHFANLFASHYFWRLLRNTLLISTYRLLWGFPAPIVLALLLNEVSNSTFKRTVQTITYLPHFISWVVISGLAIMLLSPTMGPVNALMQKFGMEPITFLADTRYFRSVLVTSSIWRGIGWGSIVYLAAISNVPQEQYESAYIDGATRLQRAIHITLPSIQFIIIIFLILRIGKIIDENFQQIFNLYNPAVYEVADVFETFIYRRGILQADFSYTTAVGFFKSFTSLVLVYAANRIVKWLGSEGLW